MVFFQFSNILGGLGPGLGLAWAWPVPKTLQNIGKLEKHNKIWKLLEIIGNYCKIEGFPIFFDQKIGKPKVFQHFLGGQAQARPGQSKLAFTISVRRLSQCEHNNYIRTHNQCEHINYINRSLLPC